MFRFRSTMFRQPLSQAQSRQGTSLPTNAADRKSSKKLTRECSTQVGNQSAQGMLESQGETPNSHATSSRLVRQRTHKQSANQLTQRCSTEVGNQSAQGMLEPRRETPNPRVTSSTLVRKRTRNQSTARWLMMILILCLSTNVTQASSDGILSRFFRSRVGRLLFKNRNANKPPAKPTERAAQHSRQGEPTPVVRQPSTEEPTVVTKAPSNESVPDWTAMISARRKKQHCGNCKESFVNVVNAVRDANRHDPQLAGAPASKLWFYHKRRCRTVPREPDTGVVSTPPPSTEEATVVTTPSEHSTEESKVVTKAPASASVTAASHTPLVKKPEQSARGVSEDTPTADATSNSTSTPQEDVADARQDLQDAKAKLEGYKNELETLIAEIETRKKDKKKVTNCMRSKKILLRRIKSWSKEMNDCREQLAELLLEQHSTLSATNSTTRDSTIPEQNENGELKEARADFENACAQFKGKQDELDNVIDKIAKRKKKREQEERQPEDVDFRLARLVSRKRRLVKHLPACSGNVIFEYDFLAELLAKQASASEPAEHNLPFPATSYPLNGEPDDAKECEEEHFAEGCIAVYKNNYVSIVKCYKNDVYHYDVKVVGTDHADRDTIKVSESELMDVNQMDGARFEMPDGKIMTVQETFGDIINKNINVTDVKCFKALAPQHTVKFTKDQVVLSIYGNLVRYATIVQPDIKVKDYDVDTVYCRVKVGTGSKETTFTVKQSELIEVSGAKITGAKVSAEDMARAKAGIERRTIVLKTKLKECTDTLAIFQNKVSKAQLALKTNKDHKGKKLTKKTRRQAQLDLQYGEDVKDGQEDVEKLQKEYERSLSPITE